MALCRINRKELRRFGIIFGIALIIVGTIHLLKGNADAYPWFYMAGALIFALGIFIPVALTPIHFVLKKVLEVIREFTARLVLLLLFYFVLTPISLIARLFGKHFLDINWRRKSDTYWIPKEPPKDGIERYEKQF